MKTMYTNTQLVKKGKIRILRLRMGKRGTGRIIHSVKLNTRRIGDWNTAMKEIENKAKVKKLDIYTYLDLDEIPF